MENKKNTAAYWQSRIDSVKKNENYRKWKHKSEVLVSRFGGDSFNIDQISKQLNTIKDTDVSGYNLLLRNIKIRLPYLLPYIPSVTVDRQNDDKDSPAKYAAIILERIANNAVKKLNLDKILKSTKLYAEIFGWATPWLRYEQKTATRVVEVVDELTGTVAQMEEEFVESECIEVDLVNPNDLFFDPQKTQEKIKWVGRKVCMTREDFKAKFPDKNEDDFSFGEPATDDEENKAAKVSADAEGKRLPQDTDVCEIYEIWDKKSKKIYFYCPVSQNGNDDLLAVLDYPCDIDFPCPLPLMYDEYPNTIFTPSRHSQFLTQYKQVDYITESINKIIPTLWVNGFYAKDLVGLDKAFNKTNENAMVGIKIPTELMAKFPNASLKDFVVVFDRAAQTTILTNLYDTRERIIGDIQRGLGIIGLMEGQTNVQEGVQTNKIKGTFGTLWVQEDQKCVAEFLVRFFNLYLAMAAQMFEPETLIEESALYELEDYKQYQEKVRAANAQMMQGQPAEMPEDPFVAAIELIKNNELRNIRLDIATEDTKSYVDAEYKAQLGELQTSIINGLQTFGNIVQTNPEFAKVFKSLLMANVRAQRIGKQFETEMESGIDFAIESIQQKAANPSKPQPDPTVVAAAQIDAQKTIEKAKIDAQTKERIEAAKLQVNTAKDGNKTLTEAELRLRELELERQELERKIAKDAADIDIDQQNIELKREELDLENALSIAQGLDTGVYDTNLGV